MHPGHAGHAPHALEIHVAAHKINSGRREKEKTMKLFNRLFAPFPSRRDLERAYLEEAVTIADLERRQREIDRGRFAGR